MAYLERWTLGLLGAMVCGCGGDRPQDDTSASASASSVTAGSSITLTDTGETTVGSADDGSSNADEAGKLDVLAGDGGNGGDTTSDTGCKKVDLLFVIDNSGSMEDEQANLISAFPDFIDAMRTTLDEAQGYNVGVISTDVYTGDFTCLPLVEGALITATAGGGSSNEMCAPFASGLRFMTQDDDLESKFACTAQIGISGDGNERPMEALTAALGPGLEAPGACNEGFLRDDALLVIVIITDEEDDHETEATACAMTPLDGSMGDPPQWFADVTATKADEESAIVVLALVGPDTDPMCSALDKCNDGKLGAEPAPRIIEFTQMFTYGFVGPVCGDYGPFFMEAIDVIKNACDEFHPPG